MCSEHMGHWRVSARLTAPSVQNSETIVGGKHYEHTLLYCERRWTGDIGTLWNVPKDLFRSVKCSLLPFIPEVEGRKRQV